MNQRKGDWIQTYSGRQYWPLDPRPEDVYIIDIAHALSNTCRFTGHCEFHYSVAQHSVLGSYQFEEPELQFQFLMHDSPEAYVTDLARPVKKNVVGYAETEDLNWKAISTRYAISYELHERVKEMDNNMLLAERAQIMKPTPFAWTVPGTPADVTITEWTPSLAKKKFIERFNELYRY